MWLFGFLGELVTAPFDSAAAEKAVAAEQEVISKLRKLEAEI